MEEQRKTLKEHCEEMGVDYRQLDDAMEVSLGTVSKLEQIGQAYPGLLVVEQDAWVVPYSERFGNWKRFWLVPEEAVSKWRQAAFVLEELYGVAERIDNLALQTVLAEAEKKCQEELAESERLLKDFRRLQRFAVILDHVATGGMEASLEKAHAEDNVPVKKCVIPKSKPTGSTSLQPAIEESYW